MDRHKIRFRFRKDGDLRLLSHHDLMRCFERMLRRADLPFRSTAGFHPTPRVAFALSLPLGVAGLDEVVELELTQDLSASDVRERLSRVAPAGLQFLSARPVAPNASAQPCRAVYHLRLPADLVDEVARRCVEVLAESECWVRRLRPQPREVDVRPYVRSLRVAGDRLELDFWVTGTGTARADEVVRLLGAGAVLDDGAVLERVELRVRDEVDGESPPELPPLRARPTRAVPAAAGRDDDESPTRPDWGLSPNGPEVE